jgi:hypothetical protein
MCTFYDYDIVALQKKNVDRPESYDSNRAKSYLYFVYNLFPNFLTQSGLKNGINIFLQTFETNLIYLLTSKILR